MNVAYSPFDDRPELVLESIALRESQGGRPATPGAQPSDVRQAVANDESPFGVNQASHQATQPSSGKWTKEQALGLIREARSDLKKGHLADARQKAKEAPTLDVAYSIMEDRPELVLARHRSGGKRRLGRQARAPPATARRHRRSGSPDGRRQAAPPEAAVSALPGLASDAAGFPRLR